ncbi:MAG: hypothetical protein HY542_00440 [Deltaproteobacteria bacterium]|nr:hypothetical protein [Deltaproteobacteria bacterium]
MKSSHVRQYTIRNLSRQVDGLLRRKSEEEGKSLNEVVLEALERGVGLTEETVIYKDLDSLAGSWKEDPRFDEALKAQDQVDTKLWE